MSNFRQAVTDHQFLITAEVAPPKGGNVAHMVEMASTLKGRVHAVNITDRQTDKLALSHAASKSQTQPAATSALPDRKSTRLNSSHRNTSRMPSSA